MSEEYYKRAFFQFTRSLDPILLSVVCDSYKIDVYDFIIWVKSEPVLQAKMDEVTQTRIIEMEKAK